MKTIVKTYNLYKDGLRQEIKIVKRGRLLLPDSIAIYDVLQDSKPVFRSADLKQTQAKVDEVIEVRTKFQGWKLLNY